MQEHVSKECLFCCTKGRRVGGVGGGGAFENVPLLGNYIAWNACMFRISEGGRGPLSRAKGTPHPKSPSPCTPPQQVSSL